MGSIRSIASCGWRAILCRKRGDGNERIGEGADVHVVRERLDRGCLFTGLPNDAGMDVSDVTPTRDVSIDRWD